MKKFHTFLDMFGNDGHVYQSCLPIPAVTWCAARCSGRVTHSLFVRPPSLPLLYMFLHLTMSALEYPYIKALLHDQITVIHNVES